MSHFIARPSISLLRTWYGDTAAGREKARQRMREDIRAEGKRVVHEAVRTAGLSARCSDDDHNRTEDGFTLGCTNDGTGCLCRCHDPEETP